MQTSDSAPLRAPLATGAATRRSLRVPRTWGLRPGDAGLLVFGNAALVIGMWVRHGQFPNLPPASGVRIAAGQIAALLGAYCALVQVVLMSRSPWLDQLFGINRLAAWHRWLGFSTVTLICGHVLFTTWGYAWSDSRSIATQT